MRQQLQNAWSHLTWCRRACLTVQREGATAPPERARHRHQLRSKLYEDENGTGKGMRGQEESCKASIEYLLAPQRHEPASVR